MVLAIGSLKNGFSSVPTGSPSIRKGAESWVPFTRVGGGGHRPATILGWECDSFLLLPEGFLLQATVPLEGRGVPSGCLVNSDRTDFAGVCGFWVDRRQVTEVVEGVGSGVRPLPVG